MNIRNIFFSLLIIGSSTPSMTVAGGLSDKEVAGLAKMVVYTGTMGTGAVVGGTVGAIGGGAAGFCSVMKYAKKQSSQGTAGVILLCGTIAGAAIGAAGGTVAGIAIGGKLAEVVCEEKSDKHNKKLS